MPVDDNLDSLRPTLDELASLVDFTAPGRDGSLGRQLLGVAVEGVADRNAREVDPDGVPWEANRGRYGEAKQGRGLPVGVGLRDGGEMVSQAQLMGETRIAPDEAVVRYGADDEARRKAQWFTNGSDGTDGEPSGASNQPPRPFFAMSEDDLGRVLDEAERFVLDWIDRA